MRIFVTGATGFIGSQVVDRALRDGHEVLALRRGSDHQPRIELSAQPEWLTASMEAVDAKVLEGCDVLLHLAAHSVAYPHDSLEACLQGNVQEPLRLFRTAIQAGIHRFVVAGSCFEYGRSGERYDYIPADAPSLPTNSYAASKAAATVAMHAMAVEEDLRLSIHRIFHVFGPGEAEGRFWPSLRRAALAGDDLPMTAGEQIRDFTPVQWVAKELLAACCDENVMEGKPQIKNLGTGNPVTLRSFAEHWWHHFEATGSLKFGELPYREGEVMRYVPQVDSLPDSNH